MRIFFGWGCCKNDPTTQVARTPFHKLDDGQTSSFLGKSYPTVCATGTLRAVKPFSTRSRTRISATKRPCRTNPMRDSSCESSAVAGLHEQTGTPACKTRNWPAYNEALKRRGSLTIWFDPSRSWEAAPTGKRGRQSDYSDTAIQTCLTMKVLFSVALRQTAGFVERRGCSSPAAAAYCAILLALPRPGHQSRSAFFLSKVSRPRSSCSKGNRATRPRMPGSACR